MCDDYEDIYSQCVTDLLKILSKRSCSNTKRKLEEFFEIRLPEEQIIVFHDASYCRRQGHDTPIKRQALQKLRDGENIQKLQKLANHLDRAIELMNEEFLGKLIQQKTHITIRVLGLKIQQLLDNSKQPKGRPSLKDLYNYVFQLALLYKELSCKPFTLDKYLNKETKEYAELTPGHEFVSRIISSLNSEIKSKGCNYRYSSANIYNACLEAQKRLKGS